MSGGAGRMVHLRHANGFETEYLHLSVIAVRAGARVRQGELVGRVGSSGLATGPHLDYRLKKNGAFINPVTAHRAMPPAEPIPQAQMVAFEAARDRAMAALATPGVARAATPPASQIAVGNRNAPEKSSRPLEHNHIRPRPDGHFSRASWPRVWQRPS